MRPAEPSEVVQAVRRGTYAGLAAVLRERFLRALGRAERAQEETLLRILSDNEGTWFGERHGFQGLRSAGDYRRAVPVQTPEDLSGPVERIAAGEPNVLTRSPVRYLQLTSGSTTGRRKMVPSTPVYGRKRRAATLAGQGFFNRWAARKGIRYGRGIPAVSSRPLGITAGGIPYGTASSGHARGVRRLWEWFSVVPFEVSQVPEPEDRRYACWRFALLAGDVSFVSAAFMAYLDTFAATLYERSEALIRDLADGTLDPGLSLSSTGRDELQSRLSPAPKLAAKLENLAERHGGLMPREVWPGIGWLLTAHAPVFETYEPRLSDWYGHKAVWGTQYGASEGLVGIPYDGTYSHAPAVMTSFLEFIPEKAWPERNPETCLAGELEFGRRYEVVVTGWNGMYRYRLGDVVEVDGAFRGVPTFRVVSRRAGILSVAGEEMTEAEVAGAVAECSRRVGIPFVDFVVDLDRTVTPARYRMWAEPPRNFAASAKPTAVRSAFEAGLRSKNPRYGEFRDGGKVGAPAVEFLPPGTFHGFRRTREAAGGPAEQLKVLHSSTDPGYIALFEKEAARRASELEKG